MAVILPTLIFATPARSVLNEAFAMGSKILPRFLECLGKPPSSLVLPSFSYHEFGGVPIDLGNKYFGYAVNFVIPPPSATPNPAELQFILLGEP